MRWVGPALGVLAVLIGLFLIYTSWKDGSRTRSRGTDRVEAPADSPRNPGASTLRHGGPTPSPTPQDQESGRGPGPFLLPAPRAPSDGSGSRGAVGKPAGERKPRTAGAGRGPGDPGP